MKTFGGLMVAAAVLALGGCGSSDSDDSSPAAQETEQQDSVLSLAHGTCKMEDVSLGFGDAQGKDFMTYTEDEDTLVIDGAATGSVGTAQCVLEDMDAPASTLQKVNVTTSLQGQLTDEFDGYAMSWTYHPDNGLDMVIEPAR